MSARYRTISGLLGLIDPNASGTAGSPTVEVELLPEPSASSSADPESANRKTRKRDSLRKLNVRHLVSRIEHHATESFERSFGGRFSRRRIAKAAEESPRVEGSESTVNVEVSGGTDPEGAPPPSVVAAPPESSQSSGAGHGSGGRTWKMVHLSPRAEGGRDGVGGGPGASCSRDKQSAATDNGHDKISADSAEFSESQLNDKVPGDNAMKTTTTNTPSVDREDSGRWSICSDFERVSLPDVNDVCDTWNEFIYLRLSEANARHLNSYCPDFETTPFDEDYQPAEAANTIISLRFTADELLQIVYGRRSGRSSSDRILLEPDPGELDDEVYSQASSDSSGDDCVFHDPPTTTELPVIPGGTDSLDEGISFRESPVTLPELPHQSDIDMKISFLIDELLETERNYINTLQKGIGTYIEAVFNGQTPAPPELCGKKYHLFGNLEYIYRFHRNAFLPKLLTTGNDVERIADVFIHFLENDSFYGYILYSMYHPKSQRVCEQHISFFDRHQQAHGDKLGVKSLILQPIQRLPRYQLMLASIFKLLIKKPGAISRNTQLHKVCVAEKRLQTLIGIMNESVTINDILQCEKAEDDEVELGFGVPKPAIVLKNQNHDNQVLFLYPKDNELVDRNKPINILHLGKFRSVYPVFINDLRLKRQYQGRLFVFERCIIYTEQLEQKCLTYRGHYTHQEIEYDFSNRQILRLSSRRHERLEIEVKINIQNPGKTHLVDIMTTLKAIIERREQRESFALDSGEVLTALRNTFASRNDSYRSSFSSTISELSLHSVTQSLSLDVVGEEEQSTTTATTTTTGGSRSQSLVSTGGGCTDKMLHFQQHHERALEDGTNQYIRSLPTDVAGQLESMVELLEEMLRIQRAINYRLFEDEYHRLSCDSDVLYLCGVFRDCFQRSEFDVYLQYVEHVKRVESILMSFEQYFNGQPKLPGAIEQTIDTFLHLPVHYVNRCHQFFRVLWSQHKDDTGEGEAAQVSSEVLRYVYEQMALLHRRVNENYQIRQLIMDVEFLNEIGLVKHSDQVKLEGSYALFRLMVTKTGLLCMKISAEVQNNETYSSVTFYCPYTKLSIRQSKRRGTHLYVYLDSRKTTLIFQSRQQRYLTVEQYNKLSTQMKQKEREKKRSFFYVSSGP